MAFRFQKMAIPDVIYIEPDIYQDERGHFLEVYKTEEFKKAGISEPLVQINESKSRRGVIRGLHYQKSPMGQAKLMRVISGEVFEVAVDVRKGSPYFGKCVTTTLDSKKKNMLFIPVGFAHGLCAISETVEIIYYCSNLYSPSHDAGILWNDSDVGVPWPVKDPVLSAKDARLPRLKDADNNFIYHAKAPDHG